MGVKDLRRKQRRNKGAQRRGYLKRWSAQQMNAGSKVDKSHVPKEVQAYFDYRGHARVFEARHFIDKIYELAPVNPMAELAHRQRVRDDVHRLVNEVKPAECVCIFKSARTQIFLMWNSKRDCYCLVYKAETWIRRSLTFGSEEAAMRAHRTGKVQWMDPIDFTKRE